MSVRPVTVRIDGTEQVFAALFDPRVDVLYLSRLVDDKRGAAQQTPEGHAVRLAAGGQVTHITAINARWLLERDGELVATLHDGRRLRLARGDVAALVC